VEGDEVQRACANFAAILDELINALRLPLANSQRLFRPPLRLMCPAGLPVWLL